MVVAFCLSWLTVYRGLFGGLMVLLGLVNGLSGFPRYFISVQEVAVYLMVAVFCSLLLKV